MKIITPLIAGFLLLLCAICLSWTVTGKKNPEIYQLTVYHYTTSAQEKILDTYLEMALLPALHRQKLNQIGVFKAIANDTGKVKKLYVLIPGKSMDIHERVKTGLEKDATYLEAGKDYLDAAFNAAPYDRMEIIYLKAFRLAPELQLPALTAPKRERVYELRSYESATEKIFRNKVQMFNEGGEIALFKRLNFNAVFYSEVIAGSKMPNLMYMTCFENMADRDAHWKTFGSDPEWKRLSAMPEYQHNVSVNEKNFLYPTGYSDY